MFGLQEIKKMNSLWFSPENKRFFGDHRYWILYGKKSGLPFLVRSTDAWSDMFDGIKKEHYRINQINSETLKIGELIDDEFKTMNDIKEWFKQN